MSTWREAVLEGVKEAARLHEQLALRTQIEATPGGIDVFSVIVQLNIPLLFRPLDGLLGTFLPKPSPGIIVTTERNLAIQRFTGAHELGHCYMGHEVSLDDKPILKRSPFGSRSYDPREAAADGDRKDNQKIRLVPSMRCNPTLLPIGNKRYNMSKAYFKPTPLPAVQRVN